MSETDAEAAAVGLGIAATVDVAADADADETVNATADSLEVVVVALAVGSAVEEAAVLADLESGLQLIVHVREQRCRVAGLRRSELSEEGCSCWC